jgi:hypothetical protein
MKSFEDAYVVVLALIAWGGLVAATTWRRSRDFIEQNPKSIRKFGFVLAAIGVVVPLSVIGSILIFPSTQKLTWLTSKPVMDVGAEFAIGFFLIGSLLVQLPAFQKRLRTRVRTNRKEK